MSGMYRGIKPQDKSILLSLWNTKTTRLDYRQQVFGFIYNEVMEEYKAWKWRIYTMDRILAIDQCTRDNIITPWMHTYSRFDDEW